jgi:hypothetical protein
MESDMRTVVVLFSSALVMSCASNVSAQSAGPPTITEGSAEINDWEDLSGGLVASLKTSNTSDGLVLLGDRNLIRLDPSQAQAWSSQELQNLAGSSLFLTRTCIRISQERPTSVDQAIQEARFEIYYSPSRDEMRLVVMQTIRGDYVEMEVPVIVQTSHLPLNLAVLCLSMS